MNIKERNARYLAYVEKKSPKASFGKALLHAFLVGGAICVFGQLVGDILKVCFPLMDISSVSAWSSSAIILITVITTGFGVFDRLARFAGAGTVIPITGFANSIASCAIEFKKEGLVFGLGAKMFNVAGPVIVNGVTYSMIVGLVYLFISMF